MNKLSTDPHSFDPEIREIEREIYDFFVNGLVTYSGRDLVFAKIIPYFFTRQTITQSELRKLTGLSAGAVSETLSKFLDMKIISKSSIGGKYHYTMDGISFGKSEYVANIEDNYGSIINELLQIGEEINQDEENLKHLDGFAEAKTLTFQLLAILERVIPSLIAFEQALSQQLINARKNEK